MGMNKVLAHYLYPEVAKQDNNIPHFPYLPSRLSLNLLAKLSSLLRLAVVLMLAASSEQTLSAPSRDVTVSNPPKNRRSS